MAIIYEPQPRNSFIYDIGGQFINDVQLDFTADILSGNLKPFGYYAGLAVGWSAVTFNAAGYGIGFVVAANVMRFRYAKGENFGQFEVFVDGVSRGIFDAYDIVPEWAELVINLTADEALVQIFNRGKSDASPLNTAYAAIGQIVLEGGLELLQGEEENLGMPTLISVSFNAAIGKDQSANFLAPTAASADEAIAMAQDAITYLDAITEAAITEASIKLQVPLPGGIKDDPEPFSECRNGVGVSFTAINGVPYAVRIPAVDRTLITDNEGITVVRGAGANSIGAFIDRLLAGFDDGNIQRVPVNRSGSVLNGLRSTYYSKGK